MAVLQTKRRTPRAGNWGQLQSVGDARRYIRQLILLTHDDKMDLKKAAVLGQLTTYLLRAMELELIEKRLVDIEQKLALPTREPSANLQKVAYAPEEGTREPDSTTTTH